MKGTIEKRYGNRTGRRFARVKFEDGSVYEVLTRGPIDGSAPNAWGDKHPFEETRVAEIKAKAWERHG